MNDIKLYKCTKCGKIIEKITKEKPCPSLCCGEAMVELKANSTDAALEKHVPVVEIKENIVHVEVGSTIHPMTEPHYIQFIILVTDKSIHRIDLTPADTPVVDFALLENEKPLKVYEMCNLHGLWVKEL